ncbi:hypothetical protein BGZ65_010863 [Modicella reniformis]|uniref:Uncharacterized protein n=1 Tax=Modicella reniformis TaxID=1440133 RepID=A0A9P6JKA5_9FUNG|nr:hypothetical protein BGZ65_010863 [Modicella reniformis]
MAKASKPLGCDWQPKSNISSSGREKKSRRRLDEDLGVMNKISEKGVWTRRPIMKLITKGLREVYVLTDEDKEDLEASLGTIFEICRSGKIVITRLAIFEYSDGRKITPHKHRRFALYDIGEVLKALGFSSHNHLVLFTTATTSAAYDQ